MNPQDRFKDYQGDKCWQAYISEVNRDEDLLAAGLTEEEASMLRTSDFVFEYVDKENKKLCKEVKEFIMRHEWLAKLPNRPTHRFTARLKKNGILAGTIIMAIPNQFQGILGEENKDKERLISRGACISWGPKNLGSWLITKSIKWMARNTQYRYFTAYSDPEARELGTIYQACNFIYLGQTSGGNKQYRDHQGFKKGKGWFSGREFRKKSSYMKYAKEIPPEFYKSVGMHDYQARMFGFISWDKAKETAASATEPRPLAKDWLPNWEVLDSEYDGLSQELKRRSKEHQNSCECRKIPPKHKYVYIQGNSKKETKKLKAIFINNNPDKVNLPYPRERGK